VGETSGVVSPETAGSYAYPFALPPPWATTASIDWPEADDHVNDVPLRLNVTSMSGAHWSDIRGGPPSHPDPNAQSMWVTAQSSVISCGQPGVPGTAFTLRTAELAEAIGSPWEPVEHAAAAMKLAATRCAEIQILMEDMRVPFARRGSFRPIAC